MQFRHIARVLAVSLVLAACEGSSTGSAPLDGVYVLQTVEGRPVPAAVDTQYWSDNVTYSVNRVTARSLEFLDRDSVVYTASHMTVTYFGADSAYSGQCLSIPVQYRVRDGRLLLIVEPALFGQQGRLRIDTLQVENDELVHNTRSDGGKPLRLEYGPASEPARCASPLP